MLLTIVIFSLHIYIKRENCTTRSENFVKKRLEIALSHCEIINHINAIANNLLLTTFIYLFSFLQNVSLFIYNKLKNNN